MMRREEWAKHIDDWKLSGLDAADYGKRHGIPPKKLYWWSWFLRSRTRRGTSSGALALVPRRAAALLPVRLRGLPSRRQASTDTSKVEVALPNGAVIRATSAVEAVWLGRLIVAGTRSC